MKIDAEVTGFEDLEELLRSLPEVAQRKVYRQALSAAATPILTLARRKAPTEKIRRNTVKKLNRRGSALGELTVSIVTRKAYNPVTGVGSRKIRPYGDKDAFYSVWYEFGSRTIAAKPYMRPAYDEGKAAALEKFRKTLKARLEAAIARQKLQ